MPVVSLSILFIGNSLTYYNDLPRTLRGIAVSDGYRIRTEMVAGPKLTLMDQLGEGGQAEAAIRQGGWDYVVLQQGPSDDSASRAMLFEAVRQFDLLVRAAGARTALYMVWPPADKPEEFCATAAAYADAAAAVGAVLAPAGIAWEHALRQRPVPKLYSPDGVHPAPLGTYLAAITILEALTGHDARDLPSTAVVDGTALGESGATVQLLQEAAHSASSNTTIGACRTMSE